MLTWVIVKARIDSSLNLYEHCVACDDENNCPAEPALQGPTLRGQPCRVAYTAYLAFDLRCVQPHFGPNGQPQCARRLFTSTNVPAK